MFVFLIFYWYSVAIFLLLGLLLLSGPVVPRSKALLSNSILQQQKVNTHSLSRSGGTNPTEQLLVEEEEEGPASQQPSVDTEQLLAYSEAAKKNNQSNQSRLFSAIASMEILACLCAPLMVLIYTFTLNSQTPGAVFIVLGVLSWICAAVIYHLLNTTQYTIIK